MNEQQRIVYISQRDNYYHKTGDCKEACIGKYVEVEERVARVTHAIKCPECCKWDGYET
jgi:hypothetical protein